MDSIYTNPELSSTAPALADNDQQDTGISNNFLYQAATILGMLLFLFSF
jgi:hypothetical protein